MTIATKKEGKFELVYIVDAIAYYPVIKEAKKKHTPPKPDAPNQSQNEYSMNVFVSDEDREKLEDMLINKQLFKVGVDKNKKRKIKYPLDKFPELEGLNGMNLTCHEFTNAGKPSNFKVIGKDGKDFDELVGNGSIVTVKLWGYRNNDGELNVQMNLVQVKEHVPYSSGGGGMVTDDILGVTYDSSASEKTKKETEGFGNEMDVPFDVDDSDESGEFSDEDLDGFE